MSNEELVKKMELVLAKNVILKEENIKLRETRC